LKNSDLNYLSNTAQEESVLAVAIQQSMTGNINGLLARMVQAGFGEGWSFHRSGWAAALWVDTAIQTNEKSFFHTVVSAPTPIAIFQLQAQQPLLQTPFCNPNLPLDSARRSFRDLNAHGHPVQRRNGAVMARSNK
jgi:hypothetical protein